MVRIPRSDQYAEHEERFPCRDGQDPCIVCGRAIKTSGRQWLHLHMGGTHAVTETEAATLDPLMDLGMYPVGSDCLRQHPELRPYLIHA